MSIFGGITHVYTRGDKFGDDNEKREKESSSLHPKMGLSSWNDFPIRAIEKKRIKYFVYEPQFVDLTEREKSIYGNQVELSNLHKKGFQLIWTLIKRLLRVLFRQNWNWHSFCELPRRWNARNASQQCLCATETTS